MSPKSVGTLAQAWYRWKALRFPWRKRYLVGFDLGGNTYWEFRLSRSPQERLRRIVKYPRSTHYSQVKVSPQWHQWLRYTRDEPPTAEEQEGDVVRQQRMKYLAAEADRRWEAKPRVMEDPNGAKDQPTLALARGSMSPEDANEAQGQTTRSQGGDGARRRKYADSGKEDPWAQAKKAQSQGDKWQPAAWDPTAKT